MAVVAAVTLPVEVAVAVVAALALPVELSDAVGTLLSLADEVAVAVVAAVTLPVEVAVAVATAVTLPVELSDAVETLLSLADEVPVKLAVPVTEGSADTEPRGVPDDMNDSVAAGDEVPDSLGVREYDSTLDVERLMSGDGDIDVVTVFVFELVKDCDGLDECVDVLELVVVVLTDVDTLGDCVLAVLPVCDTDTVDVFELVWLLVDIGLLDGNSDVETDALGDSDSELKLVIDGCGVIETLVVMDELADVVMEPVSL